MLCVKFLAMAGVFYCLFIGSISLKKILEGPPKTSANSKSASKKKKSGGTTSGISLISELQLKGSVLVGFAALWWALHPLLANPVLPHPLREVYTHPTYPLQILSAEQSVTGLITVGQWLPPPNQKGDDEVLHSARYMRASHSILGGVWTHGKVATLDGAQPLQDYFGIPLGDSIYATFVIQEAARMVNSTKVGRNGRWKNALVM